MMKFFPAFPLWWLVLLFAPAAGGWSAGAKPVPEGILPLELRPPWRDALRAQTSNLVANLRRKALARPNLHEVIDSQGNHFFVSLNGRLFAHGPVTPFARPASAENADFYLARARYLLNNGHLKPGARVLREILNLDPPAQSPWFAHTRKIRGRAAQLLRRWKAREGSRWEEYWNHWPVIFTEDTSRREINFFVKDYYARGKFPADWTVRHARQKRDKFSAFTVLVLDSRPDYLLERVNQNLARQDGRGFELYDWGDYYRQATTGNPLPDKTTPFEYQIVVRLDRFPANRRLEWGQYSEFWFRRQGYRCRPGLCRRGVNPDHRLIIEENPGDLQSPAGRPVLRIRFDRAYRGQPESFLREDYIYLTDYFGFIISFTAREQFVPAARQAWFAFLQNFRHDPP